MGNMAPVLVTPYRRRSIARTSGAAMSAEDEDRSANGPSASVGLAGRIMRSKIRDRSGWIRPDCGGACELPIRTQGRIFLVGAELLAEAEGNAAEAEKQMALAAGPYRMDHFMGKIAQLHCRLRGWKPAE
jgi:hypothetical protein